MVENSASGGRISPDVRFMETIAGIDPKDAGKIAEAALLGIRDSLQARDVFPLLVDHIYDNADPDEQAYVDEHFKTKEDCVYTLIAGKAQQLDQRAREQHRSRTGLISLISPWLYAYKRCVEDTKDSFSTYADS